MNTTGIDRDEVLRSLTAEAVARQYNLKLPQKNNGNIKCPCRGHDDKTPSASIDMEQGLWNCFSCDAGGDLLSLVGEMEGLDIVDDFKAILDIAADIAGVARDVSAHERRKIPKKYAEKWDAAVDTDLAAARSVYIAKKNIDITALEIDVRPCPDDPNDFMIPIRDWRGEIIGLQRGKKMAVEGSNAGGFFFEKIDRNKTLYIVEGLSDYLTMMASGYVNTIGLFSVNVPEKEILNIINETIDVRVCLDYDMFDETGAARGSEAGFKKTKKILQKVPHAKAYFASYTEKKDLSDVFMQRGSEGVAEIFALPGKNYGDLERDENKKIAPSLDPRIVAEDLAKKELVATGEKTHWIFSDGIWKEAPKEKIEKMISNEMVTRGAAKLKFKDVTETRNYLRLETASRSQRIREAALQENLGEDIYFTNGKYNVTDDIFSAYTPTDYVFSQIAIPFQECSEPPKMFLKFLNELFAGYENPEAYISFIQEWIGYCMYPKSPIHAFLYIYGSGGNGKGVLFNVIGNLVGHGNMLNYNISKLENDEERAIIQLFGKYVNLGTEERRGTNLGSPVLKSLTGGDPVTGRQLYREAFTFRPHAKMLFSSNYAPSTGESASNISRRLNLLHLKNVFDDGVTKRGDVNLEHKLSKETAEIAWWAIAGLRRLLERGWFEKPEDMSAAEKKLLVGTDPVASFVGKEKAFHLNGEDGPINAQKLYEQFRTHWIDDLGKSARYVPSRVSFLEGLEKQGYVSHDLNDTTFVSKKATV